MIREVGRTFGAIVVATLTVALWVVCLRMLLSYASKDDPGAYVVVGGVSLMLPTAAVLLIVLIVKDRSKPQPACEHGCRTQDEWRANHQTEPAEQIPAA